MNKSDEVGIMDVKQEMVFNERLLNNERYLIEMSFPEVKIRFPDEEKSRRKSGHFSGAGDDAPRRSRDSRI